MKEQTPCLIVLIIALLLVTVQLLINQVKPVIRKIDNHYWQVRLREEMKTELVIRRLLTEEHLQELRLANGK